MSGGNTVWIHLTKETSLVNESETALVKEAETALVNESESLGLPWYRSMVSVYNKTFAYGEEGIKSDQLEDNDFLGNTLLFKRGLTVVPLKDIEAYLRLISVHVYTGEKYHLLENNCDTFCNDLLKFLGVKNIPPEFTKQKVELEKTPEGRAVAVNINEMYMFGCKVCPGNVSFDLGQLGKYAVGSLPALRP